MCEPYKESDILLNQIQFHKAKLYHKMREACTNFSQPNLSYNKPHPSIKKVMNDNEKTENKKGES
jgi:hypothetical protein